MKKSNFTFLSCLPFLLFLSPALLAQQTTTQSKQEIIIIQKATADDGAVEIDQKSLEKGAKFKTYLEQLNLDNKDTKELKIEVFSSEDGLIKIGESDNEETIFFYRSAKSDQHQNEDIEKLVITLNDQLKDVVENVKPLLGVYSEDADNGVLITGLVFNSGAQKAGIQKGDIITALDNQPVTNNDEMRAIISTHKIGEYITVDFIRNGKEDQLTATLGKKTERRNFAHTRPHYYQHNYDFGNDNYNSFQERNPCKVFIGVYTSDAPGGLAVHNIIANTPADKTNIQLGDRILAFNDVEVNTHRALVAQRDLHKAGDFFTLSILRNGVQIEVDAQFDACPNKKVEEQAIIENTEIEETIIPKFDISQNSLELESINVFPNPTYGPINLKFKGEAVPTTIRLSDATGKVVYEEVLNSFDGVYNGAINYKNAAPGNMILTVQQDQKIYSQSLVLMPRA
ncbi:MAG: membrane-associated protease RseP (regulator of RpoE activity) [Saprospiraceae bacterium]|jgi:membrane-associated protease RseP (regulator of RpoE activity)